jgi:colicin import membrane protein
VATSTGGVTTEVNLVTSGFEEGVSKIVGLVGNINSALAKIGEVAIGASLSSAINKIVSDLEKLPEAVISSAAKMESSAASMASAMEIAAKKSADSWDQAGTQISESVQKAQQAVDRASRDMAYSLDAAASKAADFASQLEKAGEVASRGFTANNQQLTRSMEDVSTRGGQAAEDLTRNISRAGQEFSSRIANVDSQASHSVSNIMGSFNDAAGERSRVFNQSIANITYGLDESSKKISRSQAIVASNLNDNLNNIQAASAARIESINASFNKTSAGISRQMDAENEKFTQGLENRQAAYEDSTSKLALQHQDTVDDLSHKWELLTKHSADAAEKISRQVADQMSALRDAEEKANTEFSRKMSDLAEETLIGPKTQEEQNKLAKKRVQLGADLAQNQEAIDKRKAQISRQANEEREDLQKQTKEAQEEIVRRQQKEEELYNRRLEFIDAQYARENLKAQENHDRAMKALSDRMTAEEKEHNRAVDAAERAGNRAAAAAEKQAAAQINALEAQRKEQEKQAAHQIEVLQENFDAQNRLAANQRDRQLADVRANADRQREAAKSQRDREVEDAERAYERITGSLATQTKRAQEDWALANDNIQRKFDETNQTIKDSAQKASTQAAIEYERLGDRFNDSMAKMNTAMDEFASTHSNKAVQVAALFSEAWVKSFNEVQAAAGRTEMAEFINPDDTKKFEKAADQMVRIAKEMAVSMGRDANDVAQSMAALALSNLDPLQNDLLKTTAAMATLPQVTRGMTQVVNAFGALATGQLGEANQRFREFGVNLKEVPGLVFDANGKIVANSEETTKALAKALGKTTDQIKKEIPDASQRVLQLVEIYFGNQFKGVLERWLQTTAGQFAQAKAIYENFKLTVGESLNNAIRGPLTEFVDFLKGNQEEINKIGKAIGDELGTFVTGVFNALRRLGEADIVQGAQALLTSLGKLKDQIVATITGVGAALTEGGQGDFGAAIAQGLTNFAGVVDKVTAALAQTNFAEVAKKISDAFTGIGDSAGENGGKFERAFGTLGEAIGTTANFLVTNAPEIVTMLASIVDGGRELVKFLLEHGDDVKGFGEIFLTIRVAGDIVNIVANMIIGIAKLGEAFGILAQGAKLLGKALEPVGEALGTAIAWVLPRILPLLEDFAGVIVRVVTKLGPLGAVLAGVGLAFATAFVLKITTGIDLLTPLWDKFGEEIQKTVKSLEALGALASLAGGNPISAIFLILANALPGASEAIGKGVDDIKTKILGLFGIKVPEDQGQQLGASMATAMDAAKARAIEALNGLRDALTQRLGDLGKEGDITANIERLGTQISGALAAIATGQMGEAKQRFRELGMELVGNMITDEQFAELKGKLVTNLQSALAALETIPGEESTTLQARIREMLDAAAGAATPEELQPVLDAVKTGLAPIVDAGAAPVQALIAQIDDTLANGENLTTERVQAIVDAANAEIEKLPDQGKESGDQWVQNLIASTSKLNEVNQLVEQNLGGIGDTVQGSMDTAQGAVDTATGAIGSAFSTLGATVSGDIGTAQTAVQGFTDAAGKGFDELRTNVGNTGVWNLVTGQINAVVGAVQAVIKEFGELEQILLRIAAKGIGHLAEDWAQGFENIKTRLASDTQAMGKNFDELGTTIANSGGAKAIEELKNNWERDWNLAKNIVQTSIEVVKSLISGFASSTSTETAKIGAFFDDIGTRLANSTAAKTIEAVLTGLGRSWENAKTAFQNGANAIPGAIDSALSLAQSGLNAFITFLGEWLGKIPDAVSGFRQIMYDALVKPWVDIYQNIKSELLKISGESLIDDWFVDLAKNMPKWMGDAIQATIEAVKNWFGEWYNSIGTAFADITTAVKDGTEKAFASLVTLWEDTLKPALEGIPDKIKSSFEGLSEKIKSALDPALTAVTTWCTSVLDEFKNSLTAENIGRVISDAFSGMKDKVMEFLHELHGSGEVEPWLEDLHDTMVEGLEKTVTDSVDAFSGIADAVGDELGAASEEITTFVASLSEATNEVQTDMSNIIATARSGGASISRFQGLQLAYGDTGPGGAGGGGGAGVGHQDQQDQRRVDQEVEAADRAARDVHDTMSQFRNVDIARADDKAKQSDLRDLSQNPSPALFAANQQFDSAARNVKEAGKSMEDLTKASDAGQRKNFEYIMKGISSGQAAWIDVAKSNALSANAWSGAAKDVTSAVKDVANTTAGGAPQPTVEAPPPTPKQTAEEAERLRKVLAAGGDKTNFSVNVSTINVENGEAIDFMQTYVDQYAALLSPGATL